MTAFETRSTITFAEQQRRQKAVDTACASVRLEGFILDAQIGLLKANKKQLVGLILEKPPVLKAAGWLPDLVKF